MYSAERSRGFLQSTLRDPATGLLADGVNRTGDGRIDTDWLFSYNQGLYLGLKLEVFRRTGDPVHLADAVHTASAAIERLAPDGIFSRESVDDTSRGGGDAGLFAGIYYRYLADLLSEPALREPTLSEPALREDATIAVSASLAARVTALDAVLRSVTDLLWQTFSPSLLAADDWRRFATPPTALSTELSAVMALEARSRFEARRAAAAAD